MANFGWQTLYNWQSSGNTFEFQSLYHYDSITRVNNTVTVNGANTVFRPHRTAGSWTRILPSYNIAVRTEAPSSWLRQDRVVINANNYAYNDQEYWGVGGNYSFNVGADQTSSIVNHGFWYNGDRWANNHTITYPALGSPSGITTLNSTDYNKITVKPRVSNWGTCATAGTVRSYIADNSSFTNQTYIDTSSGANTTHTRLTANKRYWIRGWANNGGGKSAYLSTVTAVTLATASQTSRNIQATSATINATATQGAQTTNTFVQYKKQGAGSWSETTKNTGGTVALSMTGLLPNTTYEYRLAVTTDAGTWYGSTTTLKTLPACIIVKSNGEVVNAVPYIIRSNGTVETKNIQIIRRS